jgi:hypothetical protein
VNETYGMSLKKQSMLYKERDGQLMRAGSAKKDNVGSVGVEYNRNLIAFNQSGLKKIRYFELKLNS